MTTGEFWFVSDSFYQKFQNCGLMPNKEIDSNGNPHGRPCYFTLVDKTNPDLFWFIPISSKVEKYRAIYHKCVNKYHRCDYIDFANVIGYETAFLIQNMFPITKQYLSDEYIQKSNNVPVRLDEVSKQRIIRKAYDVLAKVQKGISLIFTDIETIKTTLLAELQ